jgi:hypothetical protein
MPLRALAQFACHVVTLRGDVPTAAHPSHTIRIDLRKKESLVMHVIRHGQNPAEIRCADNVDVENVDAIASLINSSVAPGAGQAGQEGWIASCEKIRSQGAAMAPCKAGITGRSKD